MDSQSKDSYRYPTDTDAGQPMDDAGEELVEGPDGNFDIVELEVLAWRRREWTQVGKKEKPSIMHEICKEFAKMEKHCDLQLVKWQQKEEQITTWLKKPIRLRKLRITVCSASKYSMRSVVQELYHNQIQLKHLHMKIEGGAQATKRIDLYQQALSAFIQEDLTNEQQQAAHNIMEKWNGPEGPTPEVQAWNAKKYGLKYMWNFAEEMWQYCEMRIISLAGWKNEEGIIQACCMDFNNDIGGGHMFDNIHTISASWREYLGNAYENPDVAAGEEVQNMAANQPRAKTGDPVKLVTNDEGDIWISDLNGHNCNSILQIVQGYLTVHYWSQVTAELQDASGYMDDDDFDSMPFADVCTTQSGLSRQHDQGRKLKSAMKNHAGHKQNDMEAQPKLKTSSNPQQSTVKPTKRCQGTNDHSSPPGPSIEAVPNEVQLWKSPQAPCTPVLANANTPSPPPKKMQKNKPAKRHGNL
ncbi:hypothetical protein EDD16DRAFT_1705694 [Pisolithus croceorrhizus]|nr:hypothetical protein EDD16DRAFT_1705694 [Pisolithus croceorrhizus]